MKEAFVSSCVFTKAASEVDFPDIVWDLKNRKDGPEKQIADRGR